jgi:hypothetical protein
MVALPVPTTTWKVWAIEYERSAHPREMRTSGSPWVTEVVGVSAESEYGAVKRLIGNRHCIIKRLEVTDRVPKHEERRVEGLMHWEFGPDVETWEYTP